MAFFRLFFCSTASKEQDDEHSKLKFKYDVLRCKNKKMQSEIVFLKYELEKCKEQIRNEIEYGENSGKVSDRSGDVFMTPREWYKMEEGFGDAYVRVPYRYARIWTGETASSIS